MAAIHAIITAMMEYDKGDFRRINHFLKVYAFAKSIGEQEKLSPDLQEILETAAITHDIGIKISEEKYGSSAGQYQQLEGPPIARAMLTKLGCGERLILRVCQLIGRHHTYTDIDGPDCQILIEADFLVNLVEDQCTKAQIEAAKKNIFQTETGRRYLDLLFDLGS